MSNRPNPFVLQKSEYKRDLDVFKHYVGDVVDFLHRMTGRSKEEALAFVKSNLGPNGMFPFRDPKIKYLERMDNGDRVLKEGTLYSYIKESLRESDVIAATFTTYMPARKHRSLYAIYINGNIKRRSKAKKEMFKATMARDAAEREGRMDDYKSYATLTTFKNLEQTNAKQKNNSLSGGHTSGSTPMYNKTAHSTLTSTCRCTSGYGNANNEKFLAGNRHYWSPMIVTNNIQSIINHTNYDRLQEVMDKYELHYPTVDDCMNCIVHCTKNYFRNEKAMAGFRRHLEKCSPLERAAFLYTGDLYQIRLHNDAVVRDFITKLSARVEGKHPQAEEVMSDPHEDQLNLATQICQDITKGIPPAELNKHPEVFAEVASTVNNIEWTTVQYADFIKVFFVSDNVPASLGWLPDSIRHVALTSDTDSTIFTVQDWVEWHTGKIAFDLPSMGLAATMIYLASATITHVLARMSANFGVEEDKIHQIAMKNEYKFDTFTPAQVAKHYYALISCQEGNVYNKYKPEIKGVHLKSSSAPKEIMADAKEMMINLSKTVIGGEQIDLTKILKHVGDTQRKILHAIESGSHDYFKYSRINPAESYKQGEEASNYKQYVMWNEVFGPKYGEVLPPPYTCLKLSVDLDSATKTRAWLDALEDRALAERARTYLERNKRVHFGSSMLIPDQIVLTAGIPADLMKATNSRKIIGDATAVFSILLETLGVYLRDEVMVMDYY